MIPNRKQIEQAAFNHMTKDHLTADLFIFDGQSYELGFTKGAEWMEQQLEPIITEYGMNEIKLKEKIAELDPKWIDAEKELPEDPDKQYLICMKNKNKENGIWLIDMAIWNGPGEGWTHFNSWEKVIGWMNLPEPPKNK